jgi:hypothetical protein
MNNEIVKNEEIAVQKTAVKAPIDFGNQGVKLASLEDAFRFANAVAISGFAPRGMENRKRSWSRSSSVQSSGSRR